MGATTFYLLEKERLEREKSKKGEIKEPLEKKKEQSKRRRSESKIKKSE